MSDYILSNEGWLRIAFFLGIFLVMGLAEELFPRRKRNVAKTPRWITNLGIVFLSSALVKAIAVSVGLILPVALAKVCQEQQLGLLNQLPWLPYWGKVIATIVIFDCIIYWQHRVFHMVPWLWRFHMTHHLDLDLDVTSGNRFHPIEIFISVLVKMVSVLLIGPPAAGVVIFEIILNGMAQFNHSNVRLGKADNLLRLLFVTPDFHITHHSAIVKETNSHYGFNLSIWDRLFGTYRIKPEKGYIDVEIGLKKVKDPQKTFFWNILKAPFDDEFQAQAKDYPGE